MSKRKVNIYLGRKRTSITLSNDTIEWLNNQIKTKRFSSVSHAIDYAIHLLKRLDKEGFIFEVLKTLEEMEKNKE